MNESSLPAEPKNPRIEAALREYLERVDRGESVDRKAFLSRHAEIADELQLFFAAEDELKKLAANDPANEPAGISTESLSNRGQETLARESQKRRASEVEAGLSGQFGRYRIVKVLGQGAMGTVYLAEDMQLERQVALKTPHFDKDSSGELLERLYREARTAATLQHPNICPVHDVGEIDGTHYISMAFIDGHPLSDFIRSSKPQPERQILMLVRKLALALQDAHEHKIVHRDLKPANIMVDKRGEPLIMDFGLARQARPDEDIRLTQSGALVGTPAYMSPEQVDGDSARIGPLTDEYSLGVIFYELLTGQLPFRGSMLAVLGQIVAKEAVPPSQFRPGLDPRIEAACLKMMAKNPSDRFPSLSAVAEELATILKNPGARSASTGKSADRFTLPEPSEGPPAGGAGAGSSKILQSPKLKTLTGSDLTSLEELARKCLARHDYQQVIQIVERIPTEKRNAQLQTLLEGAQSKADEISFLILEIDEAVRLEHYQTAFKKAEALLKIKPGHHRGLEIQEQFGGQVDGGVVRLGRKQRIQTWSEGGWIPWSALAFGLAVVGVVWGVIVIYLDRTLVVIDAKDPGISVEVNGQQATIKVPGKQSIKVEPGEGEIKVRYAGMETETKSFKIEKGHRLTLTVAVVDQKLVAKLEGDVLPLISGSEKAQNVGNAAVESKRPAPFPRAAPVSAPNPAKPSGGFVSLFNGKDLAGWKTHPSQPGNWRVVNGILIGSETERSYLYTDRDDFKDFHLRVEVRINDGGRSGLMFRSTFGPSRPAFHPMSPLGYFALFDCTFRPNRIDKTAGPNRTGSLYAGGRLAVDVTDQLVRGGEWFTEEVIAEGNRLTIKVNGQTTGVYRDEKQISANGHVALQLINRQTIVEFRKIEVKRLSSNDLPEAGSIAPIADVAKPTSLSADKGALIAPFDESEAKAAQQEWSNRLKTSVELTNTIEMKLILIPPGEFQMGHPNSDSHPVRITRPFYLGAYEVTLGQFAKFVAAEHFTTQAERDKGGARLENSDHRWKWDPKHRYTWRHPGFPQKDTHPVVDVSWDDAREFCDWLSRKEGTTYRLPTEAEWEYACRAGTTTRTYIGDDENSLITIGNVADATASKEFSAWGAVKSSDGWAYTSPVGLFRPNHFGLYDTIGNAIEWCSDWYAKDYYQTSPPSNPPGPSAGDFRVGRGGSYVGIPVAFGRWMYSPWGHLPDWGFRVVREIRPISSAADTAPSERTAPEIFADFESGSYGRWKKTGTAFGPRPAHGALRKQQTVSGYGGQALVNSFFGGDRAVGTLTSPPFTIRRAYIQFRIGGGHFPGQACINLLSGGKVVRTATGANDERLKWSFWEVSDLRGKTAQIEIVDKETGGWGHINIDDIRFADEPPAGVEQRQSDH